MLCEGPSSAIDFRKGGPGWASDWEGGGPKDKTNWSGFAFSAIEPSAKIYRSWEP